MAYNLGYTGTAYNLGYEGAYTGGSVLVLTNHGEPALNSIMEGNQFATDGPVYLGPITGGDTSIANPDWQYISDNQLWLTNVNDIPEFYASATGTVTYTIPYEVAETGATGEFTVTVDVVEETADVTAPVTTSVTVPTSGTYTEAQNLDFTVNWDETVVVTGTPAINLTVGGSARQANYVSGSNSTALLFRYTIQSGDEDTDGITVGTLTLDGGTIQDAAGNGANLTLNSVGDASGVLVDATVAEPTTPQSLVTIGTIQTELDSASVPWSYPGDDATSIEYSFNYGAWQTALSSPLEIATLSEDTSYNIRFRPVNAQGSGDMSQKGFRTKAQTAEPGPDDWPFSKGISYAAPKTWTWGKRHPKTGMRVRIYK